MAGAQRRNGDRPNDTRVDGWADWPAGSIPAASTNLRHNASFWSVLPFQDFKVFRRKVTPERPGIPRQEGTVLSS